MDKDGEGGEAGKAPPDGLLDAAGLFGAYWGRDGGAGAGGGGAAAAAQAQAALFGFGSRYPPPTTLGVAANQAASLGLHPAASAAWWSMASHLAAQDYLARLQASGLNFSPLADPYAALSALSGAGLKQPQKPAKLSNRNERSGRSSTSSSASTKEKSPSSSANSQNMSEWGSQYGLPKTSSPSSMHSHSQSLSSLASLNSLVSAPHQSKPSKPTPPPPSKKPSSSSSMSGSKGKERELALLRGDLMLAQAAAHGAYHAAVAAAAKGKNMSPLYPFGLAGSEKDRHAGIDSLTGLPHTILSAALEGGDPSSVLGGVRLPPDTEIIKYTSSLAGPKVKAHSGGSGTTRGRKKTISLDPPHVSLHPAAERPDRAERSDRAERTAPLPSKRPKLDEYGNSRSSVEVIRLPNKPERAGANSLSGTPPPNLSDYAGISRELLQTIASQSGVSLAALERQLAGAAHNDYRAESGLNLSTKAGAESPLDLGAKGGADDDAPLNLSLKPTPASSQASDALSRLTSLSSSLSASSSHDRISRRKPGARPRRAGGEAGAAESPRPKSSGSEDSESVAGWAGREGRPRNLGRGVSKPKKNTVASLLAQSRALGLRPALAHQLLAETDLEKLKALLGETASTDSECPSDSGPSDSDASDTSRRPNEAQLRLPLALGWKRVTVIKGLSRNCSIKGDVTYSPPEPHAGVTLRSMQDVHSFLESNPSPPLSADSFSFSARTVLGEYVQPAADVGEPLVYNENEINKRLEEARALSAGGRPTPPPLDRRMELARLQQAARDARRDASARSRDQVTHYARLERSEKAELAKREKEARSQQLLEHINKNRTQLTIEPLPAAKASLDEWRPPDLAVPPARGRDRALPPISLSLIPVAGPGHKDPQHPQHPQHSPIKTIKFDQSGWKEEIEEYNALDKMKDFAEKAAFDLPKRKDKQYDFSIKTVEKRLKPPDKENNLEKLIESYSRITEFINGCDWSKLNTDKKSEDPKSLEQKYLDAKNEFMSQHLMLMPTDSPRSVLKEVIDLSEEDDHILTDIMTKKINKGTFSVGKDGALSISVNPLGSKDAALAKRRKQEELERQKIEEQAKRQQERELKRQQAILLKEQERERRRQHTTFIRQLDSRRRWEERERRKHQNLLDRLLAKEKKLQQRRKEMELLSELRRPQEDSSLSDQKPLPTLNRIPGLKLPGQAMADLLQVYEFIHNFGQTLGFDMEAIPTLNTFQMALLPDCSVEAEEELLQVLTQLLVTAIEDPGIPHPGRHTTLLGHAIRMGDITPHNVSEVLRIYLYANATGEVKALTGLTAERERERRVADHHQTQAEMQLTCANSKNSAYYEHLHANATYKLSEALRDKPFLALNATTKARILAFVCDELLQNKAVLRQLDAALEHLNLLKKERYLLDMKIRKVRVLQQRKARAEQTERQQALALERMQRLVDESAARCNTPQLPDDENQQTPEKPETPKKSDKESSPPPAVTSVGVSVSDKPAELSPYEKASGGSDSDKEALPELPAPKSKELLNNNKDESPPPDVKLDKDSVSGDCDAILSDLESEGTQPEEDEDKNLSSEELSRKLDKLLKQSEQQLLQLTAASHALRATCYGQDRYWRRYWSLGKCGGIFVEAMESAQPEIMHYHQQLEANALRGPAPSDTKKKKKAPREKKESLPSEADRGAESEAGERQKQEEALKSELELKSIKSELNLSDHTQIIKYEPNVKHGACKVEGSSIKMEEKYIQQKQNNEEQDMLDIEDSIPTAFLVQKPTHKPMFATQAEPMDKPQEIVKVENIVKNESEIEDQEETKDQLVNNLEELRKMAEAVSSQLDAAKKAEAEVKEEIKQEPLDYACAHQQLYTRILEGKWFSILRHESSFLNNINDTDKSDVPEFCDNEHTCSEVILCQGHKWDVSNNLHLLNDPSLFTLNSMVTSVQVPSNNIYTDSSLTMSGLDQDMIDSSFNKDGSVQEPDVEEESKEQDNDLEKELRADALKAGASLQRAKAHSLSSLGLLNFNALSTYVTCDSPPPIQMSLDELEQLDHCKLHGLPKKIEGTFVPRELRHGWWRITEAEQLRELLHALHPRGVRERELQHALTTQLPTLNNKVYIEAGDILATELCVSHLDRVIAQNGGFPSPDSPSSYSAHTARRCDMQLLAMVETLEERVAAASMQVKGWRPAPRADAPAPAARARHKLQALEAHIERRYLKPPLALRYASNSEVTLGAVLQAEHGNASATSPQNCDSERASDGKDNKGIARGLATWREAVSRSSTAAQLAQLLQALEAAVAWDKSIMKANCQFCLSGDNEDQLLLCDGCDKGYHTYCFKPRMDKIPDGDWYCWECVNKARGERVCIVCGGAHAAGRTIPCALCARAYHQDCHYPPLLKNPRGKWYCSQCISRAPPKKPRNTKKRDAKHRDLSASASADLDQNMVPSPAASHASTSTTAEECSGSALHTPEKHDDKLDDTLADSENGLNHHAGELSAEEGPPEKRRAVHYGGNGALQHDDTDQLDVPGEERDTENVPLVSRAKKEKNSAKKLVKDLQFCKSLLCEMECHEHAWPFLLPVNTKQFPQYKKVIKCPMDLSTIKRKLQDNLYKCKEEFASDVRLMFSNCEVFNEDDSPVGRAGHNMRHYFDERWAQL